MKRIVYALLLAPTLAIAPNPATAQAVEYTCVFDTVCSSNDGCGDGDLSIDFVLDINTGDAVMVGNNGMSDVFVVTGTTAITFLEPLGTGVVQVTTISSGGEAVHSRHSVLNDRLVPSQQYGRCEVTEQ